MANLADEMRAASRISRIVLVLGVMWWLRCPLFFVVTKEVVANVLGMCRELFLGKVNRSNFKEGKGLAGSNFPVRVWVGGCVGIVGHRRAS